MAPIIYDDLIVIGPGIADFAIKGWVGAFRLDNGEQVWRFNIVPAPGEPGSETWKFPDNMPVGGGGVWTTPTLDPERGLLYVATANPAPALVASVRGGTNLYTDSIVALNIRTGKLAWYRQLVPYDTHDWDLTHASPLYQARIGGRLRTLIASAGKDGLLRSLDRDSQEPIFETPVTTRENASAPITPAGTHVCPGFVGGVEWNGPAYHAKQNILVAAAVDWCATFHADAELKYAPGQLFFGGRVVNDKTSQGWITAVDGSTGAVRWRYRSPTPVVGAVTATAGGLILGGELNGDFIALDAATGAVRFRYNTGGPIGGGIITYEVAGRQYVAVASGRGAKFWSTEHGGNPTIVVFALDAAPTR
jgi:alcohol dehydrogenase (cytochrome c)